jgi:hypothetical protein
MTATSTARIGLSWRIHGVSLQGYSHLRDGIECQDAYRHVSVESAGAVVLAVADGAGSRHRSAEGATLAVGLCADLLSKRLSAHRAPRDGDEWTALLTSAFQDVVQRFRGATAQIGSEPGAFAATLTAAVLAWPWIGVASLGDGFVITRVDDGAGDEFHLVSSSGAVAEYVNETVFLSSPNALSHCLVHPIYDPDVTAVMLSTDGLAPLATTGNAEHRRPNPSFLTPVFDSFEEQHPDPAQLPRFLLQERVSALSADDKTLLLAVAT